MGLFGKLLGGKSNARSPISENDEKIKEVAEKKKKISKPRKEDFGFNDDDVAEDVAENESSGLKKIIEKRKTGDLQVRKERKIPMRENNVEKIISTSNNKIVDASSDRSIYQDLVEFNGEILTAPDGRIPINETQMQYVAMLSNGWLVCSRSHINHHDVSSVRSLLRLKGIVPKRTVLTDLDTIQRLYSVAESNSQENVSFSKRNKETSHMQDKAMKIVAELASTRSSDIHIVVQRHSASIEFRMDSVIVKQREIQSQEGQELCMAIFNMSDVSDPTYLPMEQQGARITSTSLKGVKFPPGVQSIRLQFSPLPNMGRYLVMRLLYDQQVGSDEDIDKLGYAPMQIRQIKEMRRRPYGINIVSGPTGSGKSTTLQRGLIALMRERPGINVVTIEDPPEYIIPGARQIPVSNAATAEERRDKFRAAINGSMRLDPDVIMIGEMRDKASAGLAFEAAMTGHGVWTTLHANDAVSILDRLRDIGVEIYNLCDSSLVTGLVGQRLLRLSNTHKSVSFKEACENKFIDREKATLIRDLAGPYLGAIRFAGTPKLNEREFFKGRTVVAETILTDQEFMDIFRKGDKPGAIKYWLSELGGMTMAEHAFVKMCQGILDPRELEDKIGPLEKNNPDRIEMIFPFPETCNKEL